MLRHRAGLGGILAAIGGLFAVLPAAAEPKFTPPPGCTLTTTVQMHACQVANYYTCAGDAPGDQWVSVADGAGAFFVSHTDAETRWLESVNLKDGTVEKLDAAASADNASFSTLLATGRDDYDFVTRTSTGLVQRFKGFDQLTGESTSIDGVPLERCAFEMEIEDEAGNVVATRKGMQVISRQMRVFFAQTETYENGFGDRVTTTEGPVTFAFPGDADFAAATPQYDCDMMMTDLSLDHPSKEALR